MKKVFIADDDRAIVDLYARMLKLSNYDVETAVDGQDALDKLSASNPKPDLICLDMVMPKLSGFEVLQRIKNDDSLKEIPVMALTNMVSLPDMSVDLEKVRALGAVDIVIKSDVDPKELVQRMESIMQK